MPKHPPRNGIPSAYSVEITSNLHVGVVNLKKIFQAYLETIIGDDPGKLKNTKEYQYLQFEI